MAFFSNAYYMWDRIVQGSINGPNVYGRLAALTSRMGQGMADSQEMRTQT